MKIKQILGVSLSLIATLAFLPKINQISSQAESINPADTYFLEFIDENVAENVFFESRPLYNVDLQVNGYEYTFEIDGQNGYALLAEMQISGQTVYEVEELFYNKQSPFSECIGLPVYVTFNLFRKLFAFFRGEFFAIVNPFYNRAFFKRHNHCRANDRTCERASAHFVYARDKFYVLCLQSALDFQFFFCVPNFFHTFYHSKSL